MRHDQMVQEATTERAREANKGKAREVVPYSEEEEDSEELASSASEECISIHHHLGIHGDAPDADVDDTFVALAKSYEAGEDMNMAAIYAEIGWVDSNWADNPAINIIPKTINNSILNPRAIAWHKIIMANIDPKTHGAKFNMRHVLLIFVLMIEGGVNLPRIMRDILLVRPTKHPRHLLPFPVFITRLANRYEVPEFPNDKFHTIRPVDMYVPYDDWRGESQRTDKTPQAASSTGTAGGAASTTKARAATQHIRHTFCSSPVLARANYARYH
ncbi:hypothetical protein PIB30_053108 [Stylosanthes scabra]|uniref:Uncharacterized protein n=1 Tax=Stylosanthes scabra TaxID=79078 RepID=A0ABU6UH65_9FABA|nr:hypothetical protein [Stylosanthes scabra]